MDLPNAIVLAANAALGLELLFVSVPSVVSMRQRLRGPESCTFARKLGLIVPVTLIVLLFLIPPVVALAPRAMAYLVPVPALMLPGVRWFGVALLVLGKTFTPLSVPPLRRAMDQGRLARSGLFAWSRNPGLVGMFAFYLGNALVFPCAVLLAGFPFYVVYMHRRVLMEEQYLRSRFPLEYAAYAACVPRYLGRRSKAAP